jgi:glyoxylase-like metal-dependent hydrolase (beta-lactamase superfamily II)
MSGQPIIRAFFDEPTNTVSYLVADPATRKAAIIDPVFDYDHNSGTVDTRSIKRLTALPPETRLCLCHNYKAPGRDTYAWETTVAEQRERNVHVKEGVTEEEFVAMRTARDAKLAAPRLLLPSI